jgi:hypothetical protein
MEKSAGIKKEHRIPTPMHRRKQGAEETFDFSSAILDVAA